MEIGNIRGLPRAVVSNDDSIEMQVLTAARGTGVVRHGDWDEVIHLLHAHHLHPDAIICPRTSYSLLTLAATEASPEACTRLIALGADQRHGGTGSRTPLIHAIYARDGRWGSRHRKVVDLLASTVNQQDSDGRTALMFASVGAGVFGSKRGNLHLIKQLIAHGADLSMRNRWGRTALMEAIRENNASPKRTNADVVDLLKTYALEKEAWRQFEENYQAQFSETGEMTVRPKSVVAEAETEAAAAPAKAWTRTRAAREDASVQAISRKVEKFFGLPEDSVALVDKKRKPLRGQDTIGTLWRKHSK